VQRADRSRKSEKDTLDGFKVIEGHRIVAKREGTCEFLLVVKIVTSAVSCTVLDTATHWSKRRLWDITLSHLMLSLRGEVINYQISRKLDTLCYPPSDIHFVLYVALLLRRTFFNYFICHGMHILIVIQCLCKSATSSLICTDTGPKFTNVALRFITRHVIRSS